MMLYRLYVLLLSQIVYAQSGCKTIGQVVDCKNLNLYAFPDFTRVPNPGAITIVNLAYNNINSIPAHAFKGVSPTEIILENNQISSIAEGAFDTVYDKLHTLKLKHNRLTYVPHEIGKLNNLTYLDIKDNSFLDGTSLDKGITDTVFRNIGDSIREFHFGGGNMATWPSSALHHFQKLDTLDYEGGFMSYIPYNGFHGFEHTLKKLYISHTQLRQVPLAISSLTVLQELYFDDNTFVGNSGILTQSFSTVTHTTSPLRVLSLQNDGLTRFPAVLRNLLNLKELHMDRNRLWYVADDAVHLLINSRISKMGLSGCHLDRIPQALLKLSGMQELDVSDNNIQSIERYDLSNHTHMAILNVSHNPLAYISTEAFQSLPALHTIDFSSTSMTQIPEAIQNTHSLTKLDMTNCLIECTCDLTWIPMQLKHRIDFVGTCETIEKPINSYIKERLLTCPRRK